MPSSRTRPAATRLVPALLAGALTLAACSAGPGPGPACASTSPAGCPPPRADRTPTGSATPGTPAPRSFSLVATGDVLLHPPLWEQARTDGGGPLDFAPALAGVRPLVEGADLALCHLETPLAPEGGPYRGYPSFSAPPQVVPALVATGYDACSTASNHSFDQGAAGIRRTLDDLDAAGLAHTGTARSPEESDRPTVVTAHGVRVALLSYAFGFNGIPAPGGQTWLAHLIDPDRVLRDAARARAAGAEVVVVSMHWGTEYVAAPSAQQLAITPRLLASPDVDLVVSHHAHVVEPVERVGGKWVVYGLGNLLAAHGTGGAPLREGLLVRFVFTQQPDGRFTATAAGYAPLLVTDTPPLRVLDVAATLRRGGAPGATVERLQAAWQRTTATVGSRGAAAAGLVPLSTP